MLNELKYVLTGVVGGRELSDQEYEVFYERSVKKHKFSYIAFNMRISESACKTYYNRAIRKLSKQATLISKYLDIGHSIPYYCVMLIDNAERQEKKMIKKLNSVGCKIDEKGIVYPLLKNGKLDYNLCTHILDIHKDEDWFNRLDTNDRKIVDSILEKQKEYWKNIL